MTGAHGTSSNGTRKADGVHEREVAGVPRRDHGLARRHRRRKVEAEALGAVERHEAVTQLDERLDPVGVEVTILHDDVGPARDGLTHTIELDGSRPPLIDFNTSDAPSSGPNARW